MKKAALALVLALSAILPVDAASPQNPILVTASGSVEGQIDSAKHVSSFKGIPFAAPPVGDLRWRPPMPPAAWKGVWDGSQFRASCVQRVHGDFLPWTKEFLVQGPISEDCLYLNVWTPRAEKKASLPVIVFIHGGAFTEGSGAIVLYDGTNLASTGVVVVTINYRLGVFGFLAHPELTAESSHHSSGNYGLLDQIAALKWVRSNIGDFGGDPHRVTIWGQSAGAFSVGALLASAEAKGLFDRAMADSGLGVAELPMPNLAAAEKNGKKFAAEHHAANIKELRAIAAVDLLSGPQAGPMRFSPIVDGWVLKETPNALNEKRGGNDVPIATGYQANDWLLFSLPVHNAQEYDGHVRRTYGTMADEFEGLYPGRSPDEVGRSLSESARDRERVSMFLWAKERLKHYHGPVFTYFFDRAIPWPQHPEFGAFHSGELPYFFRNLQVLDRPWKPIDNELSLTASAYLKAFASGGNPNAPGLPEWSAVNPVLPETMEIGAKTQPMALADKAKYEFWIRYFSSPESKNAPVF